MRFDEFTARIGSPGPDGLYPVQVIRSGAGEPEGAFVIPFSERDLEERLVRLNPNWSEVARGLRAVELTEGASNSPPGASSDLAREFGSALFEGLLSGEVGTAFRLSRQRASDAGRGLRIRLRIDDPALAALPWELMYDPAEADFVCLSNETPLVRHLELSRSADQKPVELPLRILGMIAEPADLPRLDADRERSRMSEALAPAIERELLKIEWLEGQTWRELLAALRGPKWHVFHFVGHGAFDEAGGQGALALADETGRSSALRATELGRLLSDHPTLRLVVLNACQGARGSRDDLFSSTASTLIRRGLPAVVAMQHDISDAAAIEFSRELYAALVDRLPIDAAVAEGRKAMSLAEPSLEWATPVLHMRSPDGVLFPSREAVAQEESDDSRGTEVGTTTPEPVDPFVAVPGLGARSRTGWWLALGAIGLALLTYVLFLVLSS